MTNSVSILDVAESAGVSAATASRVMSKSNYPVSESTRRKVLEAASKLNYTPNALARGMKTRRSNLIAILVGDNSDPYFAAIVRGVEEIASEGGFLTIVCNTNRDPARELNYLQVLRDYRADGVVFAGSGLSLSDYSHPLEEVCRNLKEQGTVLVTLSQHSLHVPSVQADNFGGGFEMTSRLIELGHRRIAFVTGPSNLTAANVRLQGYLAALARAGITVNSRLLLSGDFTMEGGKQAALALDFLPPGERPTAIFGASDETAIGILTGLHKLGWKVPEEISVCGFGDLEIAQQVFPALTTVHIDLRELGRRGAFNLLAQIKQEKTSDLEVLPVHIIERGSTAPPTGKPFP